MLRRFRGLIKPFYSSKRTLNSPPEALAGVRPQSKNLSSLVLRILWGCNNHVDWHAVIMEWWTDKLVEISSWQQRCLQCFEASHQPRMLLSMVIRTPASPLHLIKHGHAFHQNCQHDQSEAQQTLHTYNPKQTFTHLEPETSTVERIKHGDLPGNFGWAYTSMESAAKCAADSSTSSNSTRKAAGNASV